MGIESDQVVYEYLSRVGDLAQQRQLPSSTRMRLVSGLRDEIDRRRAKAPVDSPAAVRRIIARLGTPDEVVEAAGAPGDVPEPPATAVPVQRVTGASPAAEEAEDTGERAKGLSRGLRRVVPRPRSASTSTDAVPPPVVGGAAPPHLAPLHELGEGDAQPDWWRVGGGGGPGGDIGFGVGDSVPGFVGGVEIPELLKPPPVKRDGDGDEAEDRAKGGERGVVVEKGAAASASEAGEGAPARRRVPLPRLRPAGGGWTNPLLLLAAVLLVAGAVMGSLVPLGLGWLIAYLSRRLTPAESKWAVMGLPGVVAAGGVVWLWGRSDGRWGEPIAQGQMSGALAETWPWVLRVAAVSSAVYLLWRSQRVR
ncbi:hypothetical protein ACF1HJ_39675 [Streptomyces sp. NPDC013978]|uniref:hypothetical protein n=1 Tax=Streptomyces sp. NPDC013978 TaxID=3364869 RepID=UPI0036FB64E7